MNQIIKACITFLVLLTVSGCKLTIEVVGSGEVKSSDHNIQCPSVNCSHNYSNSDEEITLTATADANWVFSGYMDASKCTNGISDATSTGVCILPAGSRGLMTATFIEAAPLHMGLSEITPNNNGDIIIPEYSIVTIDASLEMGFIDIKGILRCPNHNQAYQLTTDGIMVSGNGAEFLCGTKESPYPGTLDIVLKGNRDLGMLTANTSSMHMGHQMSMNDPHEHDALGIRSFMAMHHGKITIHSQSGMAERTRLAQTAAPNSSEILLVNPMDWQIGQEIVIATTSFNVDENERRFITAISADKKAITLDAPLNYRHHGETESFSNSQSSWLLDQRAHVINLERNVTISAVNDDTFTNDKMGGHVMVMMMGEAYIQGVAFKRMGQMGVLGRYPFHWHRIGNGAGQYVEDSIVVESVQRCYTIHGTTNVTLNNNACYDHFSHGYFLEDGDEFDNTITNNIGILSRRPPANKALLISDFNDGGIGINRVAGPATFWISHPTNTVDNNIAVASEGSGFWMAFVNQIACTHSGCNSATLAPIAAPTTSFNGNQASSNLVGITWDGAANGAPLNNPLNPKDRALTSAHYKSQPTIQDMVAYKSANAGMYYRGRTAVFKNAIFADNKWSVFVAYNQSLEDSLIVAKSANHDPSDMQNPLNRKSAKGILLYDGPFDLNNTHFAGFSTEPEFAPNGNDIATVPMELIGGAGKYTNIVRQASFNPEPFHKINLKLSNNWADSFVTSLRDVGKSLDYYPAGDNATLFRPNVPMNQAPSCVEPANSHQSIRCDYEMGVVRFGTLAGAINNSEFTVTRSDGASYTRNPNRPHNSKFSVIIDRGFTYQVSNIDVGNNSGFRVFYEPENRHTPSPLIHFGSFAGCDTNTMAIQGLAEYPSQLDLESAASGYTRVSDGIVARFEATARVPVAPNPTPGVDAGRKTVSFVCQ